MLWTIAIGLLLIVWFYRINKNYYILALFAKRIKTTDGSSLESIAPIPKPKTIFGNTFDVAGMTPVQMFRFMRYKAAELKKSYIVHIMGLTIYNVIDPIVGEIVLTNSNLITKGVVYGYLKPFLRNGLLTSTDKYWHSRRKLLTPAFHFNILEQFLEIFKEESQKFIGRFQSQAESELNVKEEIPIFTLNSVCETALGVKLDERLDSSNYRTSFKMIEESFFKRISNPQYRFDTIYNFFENKQMEPHYKIVHEFSSNIIERGRKQFKEQLNKKNNTNPTEEDSFYSKKKRYAMLDTLLRAEADGHIDHIGICEEVDTFMFEGFDTTSMLLIFSLMNFSLYPELQKRCYQEIIDNLDDDLKELTTSKLSKLNYLECFIKETLRLYPSVPVILREVVKETILPNKLILPVGTQIMIHIFDILRNPDYFENPSKFDPERFTPENSVGRHPYAYVPFSAGQRNCIGQKFAMLETKTLLVSILKNFEIQPLMDPQEFEFETGIIIRARNDIKVKLVRRN